MPMIPVFADLLPMLKSILMITVAMVQASADRVLSKEYFGMMATLIVG
jgi:hypothetical protein